MSDCKETRSYDISNVSVGNRFRFGIACGNEVTSKTDPVSLSYKNGVMHHLGDLLDLAVQVLRPGDRVLDLGAHIGGFALAASAMGCEVIAMEASPRNAELIKISAVHNDFKKLEILNAAVNDKKTKLDFCVAGPWGTVANPVMTQQFESISIPALRVDDVLSERGWNKVDFIKLDVEGSEVRALQGMSRLLKKPDAPIIYFESNTHTLGLFGEDHHKLKGLLRDAGYHLYKKSPSGLEQVSAEDEQQETCVDYIASKDPSIVLHDFSTQPPDSKQSCERSGWLKHNLKTWRQWIRSWRRSK